METIVRASVIFWVLWIVTRGLGKRELSEMSPFELILLVVIGDLIQQGVTQEDFSIVGSVIAVATFAAWVLLLSVLTARFPRVRKTLEGQPVIVVQAGRLCRDAMRYERLTDDDVHEAAREKGIGSLDEVAYGILEPDGKLSFLRTDPPPADTQDGNDDTPTAK